MNDYISNSLEKLRADNYESLNIVLGNESCDLDSAVCSVTYAAFLHWQYTSLQCRSCTRSHRDVAQPKDDIYLPLLNVNREDYKLKTEVEFCFREHDISESHLLFRDDIDLKSLVASKKVNLTLVDHHVLAENDRFLAPYVTEIIDHRPTDKTGWCYKDTTRSTIEIVGSCATLVAQRMRDLSKLMSKGEDFFNAYPLCSDMLHSTIILDTVNFSKEVNKATPHDVEIALFLEGLIRPEDRAACRQDKLSSLVAARKDVSSLTALQLLRKDVKLVADVLVPSFPILVKEFLQRPGAQAAILEEISRRNCNMTLLLGMSLDDGLQRDGAVYATETGRAAQLLEFLQNWSRPSLQLATQQSSQSDCLLFNQMNLNASRKQYIPALNEFLQ